MLGFAESDRGKEIEFKYIVDGNWTTSRFVNIKESGHGNNFFVVGTELPKVE